LMGGSVKGQLKVSTPSEHIANLKNRGGPMRPLWTRRFRRRLRSWNHASTPACWLRPLALQVRHGTGSRLVSHRRREQQIILARVHLTDPPFGRRAVKLRRWIVSCVGRQWSRNDPGVTMASYDANGRICFRLKGDKMIPDCRMALEALALIKATDSTPLGWTTAQQIWEDQLDYATLPLFQQYGPGQAPVIIDPRIGEARVEVERLHRALKARNRTMVDNLLISTVQKLQALASETVVV
jgi:hypothetical protein